MWLELEPALLGGIATLGILKILSAVVTTSGLTNFVISTVLSSLSFTFFLSLGSSWPCGIGVFLPLLLLTADFPETGVFPDPDGLETGDPPSLDSASKYEKRHY